MRGLMLVLALVSVALARGHGGGPPPCELPSFTSKLPAKAKAEVENIWKDYKGGDDCQAEHEATHDVVEGLSPADHRKLFPDRGPSFLRGVSDQVWEQFHDLWKDHSLSHAEKRQKVDELAKKLLTGKNLEEYNKHKAEMEKRQKEYEAKVAKLSPEARAAYDQLEKLREQHEKIGEKVSESARKELESLWRGRHRHDGFGRLN